MQNISTLTKISQHVITSSSFHKLSILILLIQTCMQKAFFLKKKKIIKISCYLVTLTISIPVVSGNTIDTVRGFATVIILIMMLIVHDEIISF